MNSILIFRKLKIYIFLVVLLVCPVCKAALQSELQKMFDGMVNVTSPNSYKSQGRGVMTGGSINMRFRTMSTPVIGFTPPSLKGGCNGIDMFGGSLSFISMDQFVQLAKNIAQNAAGYAFGLAVEGLCPTCAQEMKNLQKIVQDLNGKIKSSCEYAKKIVNQSSLAEWNAERVKDGENTVASKGLATDWLSAQIQQISGSITDNMPASVAKGLERNVVWTALQEANVASWFSTGGDDDALRMLMSMTGTVVIRRTTDSDVKTQYAAQAYGPTIQFKHILYGLHTDSTNMPYKCPDVVCLSPATAPIEFNGMKEIVQGLLFGSSYTSSIPSDLGTGIVKKLNARGPAGQFSPQEEAFISASRPPILALLRDVAGDPETVKGLATDLTEIVAIETAAAYVMQSIDTIEAALNGKWTKDNETVMHKILESRREAYSQIQHAEVLLSNLKQKQDVARFVADSLYRSSAYRLKPAVARIDN